MLVNTLTNEPYCKVLPKFFLFFVCNSLSTRQSLAEQKTKAEAQTHQLQEEMNQLKQQLQQDQQKLISYQEMQGKEREEYARSVCRQISSNYPLHFPYAYVQLPHN